VGFFDRLVDVAIPRIRMTFVDVTPKSFDGVVTNSMVLKSKSIFPEIGMIKVDSCTW